MTNPLYQPKSIITTSHSTFQAFDSCAKKMENTKFFNLTAEHDRALAPELGQAIHAGYQHYLVHGDEDAALYAAWLKYPYQLNTNPMNDRSMEACTATLLEMIANIGMQDYEVATIIKPNGEVVPAIEVPFEILIKNFYLDEAGTLPVRYIGFVDAYLKHRQYETYHTLDIKSHRQWATDLTPKYANSNQCIPYELVLEKMLGIDIDNFNIMYLSAYVDIKAPKVQLFEFMKDREDFQEWARGFADRLVRMRQYYQLGWFPKNGDSCLDFKRPCKWYDVCQLKGEAFSNEVLYRREELAQMAELHPELYTKAEFDPWISVTLDLGF